MVHRFYLRSMAQEIKEEEKPTPLNLVCLITLHKIYYHVLALD